MASFAPLRWLDGYPPLEDHGLIGDGRTAALVARDGAIAWLCVPRFDAPPLFCRILDRHRGGAFTVAPDGVAEARQFYEAESAVLVTEMRNRTGLVHLEDCMVLQAGADLTQDTRASCRQLLRSVRVLQGEVELRIDVEPRGGAEVECTEWGHRLRCTGRPALALGLLASVPLRGPRTRLRLKANDRVDLLLTWDEAGAPRSFDAEALRRQTVEAWRRWTGHIQYGGPQPALVRRSAITLKLLDHFEGGAIVAAPTSSLPEAIGGPRNWDYRYAWIRDAAFSVYALRRIGLIHEAAGFLHWVLDVIPDEGRPNVLYAIDGTLPEKEWEDPHLEGYRGSSPVRWGNAAVEQRQHDVYGEILDCAYQWARHYGRLDPSQWNRLSRLVDAAAGEWSLPDHGIWEVRTPGRPFTYSAALCQVALERGARLAAQFNLPGDPERWRAAAARIKEAILTEAWDPALRSLTEQLGGGGLDASLLALPLRRLLDARHPRMVATTEAVTERLSAGQGLLYRYLPDQSPDGLPGHEGAFLLCSFWLVDNLALQGRLDEALRLYDSLCARGGELGLLSEQIDPTTGAFLGNYPQAFSHIGVISSGVTLSRICAARR